MKKYILKIGQIPIILGLIIISLTLLGVSELIKQKNVGDTRSAAENQEVSQTVPTGAIEQVNPPDSPTCVFSLRFDRLDRNGQPDQTLKKEALNEMNKVKTELNSGKNSLDVLDELTGGETEEQRKNEYKNADKILQLMQGKDNASNLLTTTPNPLNKFNPQFTINFCFTDSTTRDTKLGDIFYQTNPGFKQTLASLPSGQTSDPFIIYQDTALGNSEYGWMIIHRQK